jgi:hypothetical protein
MCFVAEAKVSASQWARANFSTFRAACLEFESYLRSKQYERDAKRVDLSGYESAFPERDFFEEANLQKLLAAVDFARNSEQGSPSARDLLLLACAANMTRRADLRRRRPDEYRTRVVDVPAHISETLRRFISDIERLPAVMASTVRASEDARALPSEYGNTFDCALTSR